MLNHFLLSAQNIVVVCTSIILDFALPKSNAAFIACAMIWRVVRIVHALFTEVEEFIQSDKEKEEEIFRLKKRLGELGVDAD